MNNTSNVNTTTSWTVTNLLKFNAVALCAVNVFFTIAGAFLNSVVIMSLMQPQLRKKLCYFMILILTCFDLAVGVVFHPLIVVEILSYWPFKNPYFFIDVYYYLEHLFVFSLTALLTMSLERYHALAHPFYHHEFATKSRLVAFLTLMQLPFGIMACIAYSWAYTLYTEIATHLLYAIVFFVTIFLNCKLFLLVKRLRKSTVVALGAIDGTVEEEAHRNIHKAKKRKITLGKISTCSIAVTCLLICYIPGIIVHGLDLIPNDWSDETFPVIITFWADTLLTINSTLDSLIFFYKNSTLLRYGVKIMAKCFPWAKFRFRG